MSHAPTYLSEYYALYTGDCVEILKQSRAESVDMIFCDPPYNLSNGGSTCHSGKRVSVDKGEWDVSKGLLEDHEFMLAWLAQCQRALKSTGTIWVSATHHALYSIGFAMQKLGFKVLNQVTWVKPNPPPNLAGRYLTHSSESIIWASPGDFKPLKHVFNYQDMKAFNDGKQLKDVWTLQAPGKGEKVHGSHPTQKPEALLERIVLASTEPGALVLDPFSGSGTTGVASLRHGRKYWGIDSDPTYHEITVKRLTNLVPRSN